MSDPYSALVSAGRCHRDKADKSPDRCDREEARGEEAAAASEFCMGVPMP